MKEDLGRILGPALRAARDRMGLTQAEVAEAVKLTTLVISRLERGQMLPSVPSLRRLCRALRVPSDTLLGLSSQTVAQLPASEPLHEDDRPLMRRLLHLARRMDDDQLRAVITVAQVLLR